MEIKDLFSGILEFVIRSRRTGTTTLIKKVASENDVWVLVPNSESKEEFGKSGISFSDLSKMGGSNPKPILLDNYTLLRLTELSLEEFARLNSMIERRDRLIRIIQNEIKIFEHYEQQFKN